MGLRGNDTQKSQSASRELAATQHWPLHCQIISYFSSASQGGVHNGPSLSLTPQIYFHWAVLDFTWRIFKYCSLPTTQKAQSTVLS